MKPTKSIKKDHRRVDSNTLPKDEIMTLIQQQKTQGRRQHTSTKIPTREISTSDSIQILKQQHRMIPSSISCENQVTSVAQPLSPGNIPSNLAGEPQDDICLLPLGSLPTIIVPHQSPGIKKDHGISDTSDCAEAEDYEISEDAYIQKFACRFIEELDSPYLVSGGGSHNVASPQS
ncbi:hypothetical protein TWF481_002961 [Arthrobotrys musiformis]|uniref:Uncharacterized protein n=1 Tax=Arthrobotrys musiformis TaxID=47236 RepID=A0AAV9VRS6_9PEZI